MKELNQKQSDTFLANEAGLVTSLEHGLGEVHWLTIGYDSSLRLRLPVCGLTSLALANVMAENGIKASAVISSPDLSVDPAMKHVMVKAEVADQTVLIDPTYSQFLDFVGLSPGYVIFGGEDLFPAQKIATIRAEDGMDLAKHLASTAVYFRTQRQPIEEMELSTNLMEDLTYDELVEQYYEIWNPDNFESFVSEEPETHEVAHRLAQFILPEHVGLVD